jgi:enoyl-CoA hydratase
MSYPEEKARPPAPRSTITRASRSVARSRSRSASRSHSAGGRAFSSGYDINALRELVDGGIVLSTPADPFEVALAALVEHPLPIIAMVGGFAVGGGCTLAAGCDVRIAGASSRFGMPPAKLGLVYSATELRPFTDLIGPARTKWMFFSGRIIDAQRALQYGLVDEVVPDDELEVHTYALAEEIANNAPLSVQGTKLIVREMRGDAASGDAAERIAAEIQRVNRSADLAEGMRAFLEKRKPEFRGA